MSTQTRTATATSTLTKVVYVTRKVQADLFNLVDTYQQISQEYAENLIHDLRILLDEEVLDRIDFYWTYPDTNVVVGAYIYKVISAGVGLVDERAGGMRYDATLQASDFSVRIYRNSHWFGLSEADRRAIADECHIGWTTGAVLDYSRGSSTADKTYAKDGLGLEPRAVHGGRKAMAKIVLIDGDGTNAASFAAPPRMCLCGRNSTPANTTWPRSRTFPSRSARRSRRPGTRYRTRDLSGGDEDNSYAVRRGREDRPTSACP